MFLLVREWSLGTRLYIFVLEIVSRIDPWNVLQIVPGIDPGIDPRNVLQNTSMCSRDRASIQR